MLHETLSQKHNNKNEKKAHKKTIAEKSDEKGRGGKGRDEEER